MITEVQVELQEEVHRYRNEQLYYGNTICPEMSLIHGIHKNIKKAQTGVYIPITTGST